MNDLMTRMDNLVRFANDLEYRMSESGFGGVFAVAEQVRRIRHALDRVQTKEIQWARDEVQSLVAILSEVGRSLEELSQVKMLFGDDGTREASYGGSDGHVTG